MTRLNINNIRSTTIVRYKEQNTELPRHTNPETECKMHVIKLVKIEYNKNIIE